MLQGEQQEDATNILPQLFDRENKSAGCARLELSIETSAVQILDRVTEPGEQATEVQVLIAV